MFSLYVLIGFLLFTSTFCSESGSNDDSHDSNNDSSDESNSSEEKKPCPCLHGSDDADFEELAGFWYGVGSGQNNLRCVHLVFRNNGLGTKRYTSVLEFIDKSEQSISIGIMYKISEAKYLATGNRAILLTVLNANFDKDNGYTLSQECQVNNSTYQNIVLLSRQPEVPELSKIKFLSHHSSEDSDSSDDSSHSSDTNEKLDIDLSQYRIDYLTLYKVQHDKNCKYIYDGNLNI